MAVTPNRSVSEKSFFRLLLELLWQLLVLLVPIFFVTLLPPELALAVVVVCAGLTGLSVRLGSSRAGRGFARLMTSAVFGLGFSLGRALPEYWNLAAAIASILAGLASVSAWESRLGLASAPAEATRASAWGGGEPRQTPEGEPIRVFNHGEIAMGGPVFCDYLFPDGVLLQGLGTSARFSDDGRYFAAPVPSRHTWELVVLDRQLRRVYHCASHEFWELDTFNDGALGGRHSPLVDNGTRQADLETLLHGATVVDLLPIVDLWLEPGDWQQAAARQQVDYRSADGRHCLHGQIALPASLRELAQPMDPLRTPQYRIGIDAQTSGLLTRADAPRIWSTDSRALVCLAREERHPELPGAYWLWHLDQGWRPLPAPWVASDVEPSFYWHELLALDDNHLRIGAYLDCAQPDHGQYGYRLQSIHSDTQTRIGHDPQGRLRTGELRLTRTRLAMPLHSDGGRGACDIESEPLLGDTRARLSWVEDNSDGLGAYSCRIGDWQLPGHWLLDHRVSDCGRYLALLPYTRPPAVAGHVVVADIRRQRLLQGPAMLAQRLLDFRDGTLSLAAILGRLDRALSSHPLRRFNHPPPEAQGAADFCRYREDSALYYQVCNLSVSDTDLRSRPDWRVVDRPQAATADGDFIQPAPDRQDAAWLFGGETEYADSWLRAGTPRLGGYLLTASGCALSDLAPSMIWSQDSRFLALTRLRTAIEEHRDGYRAWQLLVLDVRQRTLSVDPRWLRHRPLFERFDAETLQVRLFTHDWELENDEDPGELLEISSRDLLSLPAEPLTRHGDLWLGTDDQDTAPMWQALDVPASEYFAARQRKTSSERR